MIAILFVQTFEMYSRKYNYVLKIIYVLID